MKRQIRYIGQHQPQEIIEVDVDLIEGLINTRMYVEVEDDKIDIQKGKDKFDKKDKYKKEK